MSEPSPRKYKILIMILPVGVVIGTIVFMIAYFHMEREELRERSVIASYGLRVGDLEDMVSKFSDRVGERSRNSESGRKGLKQAASMIEGRLGPQNVGYRVNKGDGLVMDGLIWKSLWVDLRGERSPEDVVMVAVAYAGAGQDADANCLSTVMMLASSMARESHACTLRFVFLPWDLSPAEQNRWLLQRCLQDGERCRGIIGLRPMEEVPRAGGDQWLVTSESSRDRDWWAYLSQGGKMPGEGAEPVSVWATASVYSAKAWVGRRDARLERTIQLAAEMEEWLRRAAR